MTNKEALEVLQKLIIELTQDFDVLEEKEHTAFDKAIETLKENESLKAKIRELETELATWKALC